MTETRAGRRHVTVVGLALLIGLGAVLRLHDLDRRSISHLEMYTSGIHLPAGISVPPERLTLAAAVKETFSDNTYPPGYYVLMWMWTSCFGSSIWALRLPSALCGIACIPLVFWIGVLTRQRAAGWVAALLVAANGYLVFFDQVSRAFSLACVLGVLATVLLLLLTESEYKSRGLGYFYVLVLVLGASTHVFFWVLLAAHFVWTFSNAWLKRLPFPAAGELQVLACILASPFLAFAAYQSRNPTAELSAKVLVYARELLQFSFLFPLVGFSSGVIPRSLPPEGINNPHLSLVRWSFVLFSLVLFVAGLALRPQAPQPPTPSRARGASPRSWLLAAGVGTPAILFFVVMAHALARVAANPQIRVTEAMIVLPFALAGSAIWLKRAWERGLHRHRWTLDSPLLNLLLGNDGLIVMLAIVPFLLLVAISLVTPVLNARGMTLLGPFVLMVLARGIVRVGRQVAVAVPLCIVLAVAHGASLNAYRQMVIGRAEYKIFAEALTPQIESGDLIFVKPSWYVTPVFYYMEPQWSRFVGESYTAAGGREPHARIWTLLFYDEPMSADIEKALAGYRAVRTIDEPGARAVLYAPVP